MWTRIFIISLMVFTFFLMMWGLTGDCPYKPEGDELYVVSPALEIVRSGSWNPHWFAHPASTFIYPLALYYHFLNGTYFHGAISDRSLSYENLIFDNVILLCYVPRLMNVFMVVFMIPIIYKIGKLIFSKSAALFGICFFPISPLLLQWGLVCRADVPALFYSLLAIYFALRGFKQPSYKWHGLTGIFIGLAVSSRWPSLALLSVYVMTNALVLWKTRQSRVKQKYVTLSLFGLIAAAVTFAVTSPYTFIDFNTLRENLIEEKAAHGLGCDGLSPAGNLSFYLFDALPRLFYQFQWILALISVAWVAWKRSFLPIVLAVYVFGVLCGTSLHVFHTDKWMVPILPILALFAGNTMALGRDQLCKFLCEYMGSELAATVCTVCAALVVCQLEYQPLVDSCAFNTTKTWSSTDTSFYPWLFSYLPERTKVCFVGHWDWGHSDKYDEMNVLEDPAWFDTMNGGKYLSPFDIHAKGYNYFIWTDNHCPLYLAEPAHYPRECKFFKELFDNSELIKEFKPKEMDVPPYFFIRQRGPIFRLYKFAPKTKRLSDDLQRDRLLSFEPEGFIGAIKNVRTR